MVKTGEWFRIALYNCVFPHSKAYHLVFAKLGHTAEPAKDVGSLSFFHTTHLYWEITLLRNVHFL